MGRPRSPGKQHWPQNMYRNSAGTYWYRDPRTGDVLSLGNSERNAIGDARRLNAAVALAYAPHVKEILAGQQPALGPGTQIDADGLESLASIRSSARKTVRQCGVYFLLAAGEIVYVGQSIDCARRLNEHMNDPTKTFDSFHVIECPESALSEMESRYMAKFRPPLNIMLSATARGLIRAAQC